MAVTLLAGAPAMAGPMTADGADGAFMIVADGGKTNSQDPGKSTSQDA
jgi:hypothetical protein